MQHIRLDQCESTQTYLKEHFQQLAERDPHILISTQNQTMGQGRRGNKWQHFDQAVAFSFTLSPLPTLTLTPLEIGLIVSEYIKEHFKVQVLLKWPNDLLNLNYQKCGGILCQYQAEEQLLLVGIGLNIGSIPDNTDPEGFNFMPGSVGVPINISNQDKHDLPESIYQFMLANRVPSTQVCERWNRNCAHFNRKVSIDQQIGIFKGLGPQGEALLMDDAGNISKVISGSLLLL